ncbi:hypothetical protein THICB1_30009 [Thiomonas arsenitoxydans]|uniref:Uncharacterized protein n=1 Tax=Thiomonas arsenitoxydans (strain DSM 22701 / CIP 110005 / 3As) TaxID=426114 RepID=A0ABP1Z6I3_THIA3|nr:hypothetical protein THICB1_30009 [Thiomonas arsenitoxydans]CQR33856.1 hypothetical protein ACO7_360121 [Thiomonas arsenitoxydans]CQR34158.1 hypothetical protein ACO3_380121 [Thiomonas arsenitoxydans]CQR39496.1 hypothetical protein THICB6_80009 [Thiomonas arsenitoxydans]CQR42141.1 hypothetical protein THICB3120137 [Thiomonas sp. CB3]
MLIAEQDSRFAGAGAEIAASARKLPVQADMENAS